MQFANCAAYVLLFCRLQYINCKYVFVLLKIWDFLLLPRLELFINFKQKWASYPYEIVIIKKCILKLNECIFFHLLKVYGLLFRSTKLSMMFAYPRSIASNVFSHVQDIFQTSLVAWSSAEKISIAVTGESIFILSLFFIFLFIIAVEDRMFLGM